LALQRKSHCACGGGCPRCQTKADEIGAMPVSQLGNTHEREADRLPSRVIGPADDPAEREADAIADAILDGRAHSGPSRMVETRIRAKGVDGGECPSVGTDTELSEEEMTPVQAKRDTASPGGNAALSLRLDARRGSGDPLPSDIGRTFERQLGVPLGEVRLHRDAEAGELARSIGALAFTAGNDVYFAPDRYTPGTRAGVHLLAHELVHVAQQGAKDSNTPIRRYSLTGFSPPQETQMRSAVTSAKTKMSHCTGKGITTSEISDIVRGLDAADYVYVADLAACGESNPLTDTIKIGPSAFTYSTCCDLDSTLAHECAHSFAWGFEKFARNVECKCFGCSCGYKG
jgi:hypothetical protein